MKGFIVLCLVAAALAYPQQQESNVASGFATPKGVTPLIIGGTEAPAHAYPYQVSVQINRGGSFSHFCGGVLIAPNKVATAAHCLVGQAPSNLRVVAGDHDLFVDEGTEQIGTPSTLHPHPRYDSGTVDFDYGVIMLTSDLTLNANVNVIELAPADYVPSGNCVNSGWGYTDETETVPNKLQHVTLPSVARDSCNGNYPGLITDRMICAGAAGKGPCNGDSGGPLVCNGLLAGTVSWGQVPCGQERYPGVYANIAPAHRWFDTIVA